MGIRRNRKQGSGEGRRREYRGRKKEETEVKNR
jgi:hypothetical protein